MDNVKHVVHVKASGEYDILIGGGLSDLAGKLIKSVLPTCKIALITDDVVDGLYSERVALSINSCGYTVEKFVIEHGEKSKNLTTYGEIVNFLAQNHFTRVDAVVALGGGVVGDIAGFVAATYLRGIKYVQIPTTLLAQIDSSVGGKTAIDLDGGKNLVGAFCQPALVICDTDLLDTLPHEIFDDGMGETAKYAFLDQRVYQLIENDQLDKEKLVYYCVDFKRQIVEKDEFESGERKLLNLGHTVAHGIELLSNYTISHGKAVGQGLSVILKASLKHGYIDQARFDDFIQVLYKCVGEVECPYTIKDIAKVALNDKKRRGEDITVIAVHGIQDCRPHRIDVNKLAEYLE